MLLVLTKKKKKKKEQVAEYGLGFYPGMALSVGGTGNSLCRIL